jgi:transcriptional regulator with XRE-family HTH domain
MTPMTNTSAHHRFSGPKLRAVRIAAGLTREHVALRLGCSAVTIGAYERGDNTPTMATLIALAGALGIHPGELFEPLAADRRDPALSA